MSSENPSNNNWNLKNMAIGGGLTYAGLAGLANIPANVASGLSSLASGIGNTVGYVSGAASNILGSASPVIGSLAPFALPALAGGYVGNKLVNAMDIENATLKKVSSVAGTLAGALGTTALVGTSLGTLATLGGAGLGIYYGGKYGWKTIAGVGKTIGGGISGSYNAAKGALSGGGASLAQPT